MDRKAVALSILAALATLLTALGTHGENAVKALAGVPGMLQAWSSGLPLGVWSFVMAFALATLVWVTAIRMLPIGDSRKAPFGYANTLALMVGLAVTVAQQYAAESRDPGDVLNAVCLGLAAGLLAPFVGTLLRGKART